MTERSAVVVGRAMSSTASVDHESRTADYEQRDKSQESVKRSESLKRVKRELNVKVEQPEDNSLDSSKKVGKKVEKKVGKKTGKKVPVKVLKKEKQEDCPEGGEGDVSEHDVEELYSIGKPEDPKQAEIHSQCLKQCLFDIDPDVYLDDFVASLSRCQGPFKVKFVEEAFKDNNDRLSVAASHEVPIAVEPPIKNSTKKQSSCSPSKIKSQTLQAIKVEDKNGDASVEKIDGKRPGDISLKSENKVPRCRLRPEDRLHQSESSVTAGQSSQASSSLPANRKRQAPGSQIPAQGASPRAAQEPSPQSKLAFGAAARAVKQMRLTPLPPMNVESVKSKIPLGAAVVEAVTTEERQTAINMHMSTTTFSEESDLVRERILSGETMWMSCRTWLLVAQTSENGEPSPSPTWLAAITVRINAYKKIGGVFWAQVLNISCKTERQGHGRLLYAGTEELLRRENVDVIVLYPAENGRAPHFWRAMGFRKMAPKSLLPKEELIPHSQGGPLLPEYDPGKQEPLPRLEKRVMARPSGPSLEAHMGSLWMPQTSGPAKGINPTAAGKSHFRNVSGKLAGKGLRDSLEALAHLPSS